MKFTIQRETFLRLLQFACGVVERRQTLPILSNLLLDANEQTISLTATDLEVEVIASVASGELEEIGKTTLPARKLLDICRALPEQAAIELSLQKDRLIVRSGKSRFTLATLPADDFPNIDAVHDACSFSMAQSELKRLIDSTQFAMAQQDVRYYLNGILMELGEDKISCVATDGHRMAMCELSREQQTLEARQVIIPRKAIAELSRLLEDSDKPITINLGSNHIQFIMPGLSFSSKLIDGRFPAYQNVIPRNGDKNMTADRDLLRQAITRASVLSTEKYKSIRLHLSTDVLKLFGHNPEQEQAEEEIQVDYQGADLEIGFNAGYLLDVLAAISEEKVHFTLGDSNSSCLIQARGDSSYVIMPMRL